MATPGQERQSVQESESQGGPQVTGHHGDWNSQSLGAFWSAALLCRFSAHLDEPWASLPQAQTGQEGDPSSSAHLHTLLSRNCAVHCSTGSLRQNPLFSPLTGSPVR